MSKKEYTHTELFTQSGCLSSAALEKLSAGTLDMMKHPEVEAHLQECELCQAAAEGMKYWGKGSTDKATLKEASSTASVDEVPVMFSKRSSFQDKVHRINERVNNRMEVRRQISKTRKIRVLAKPYGWVAIAASIVLFLGIYYAVRFRPAFQPSSLSLEKSEPKAEKPLTLPAEQEQNNLDTPGKTFLNKTEITTNRDVDRIQIISQADEAVSENIEITDLDKPPALIASENESRDSEVQPANTISPATVRESSEEKKVALEELTVAEDQTVQGVATRKSSSKSEMYSFVEETPNFPGGEEKMKEFIMKNLSYPKKALENSIQGVVYVNFEIDKKGKVGKVKVLRGIGSDCDEEAIRVIKMMPDWIPAKSSGKAVSSLFTIPITFKL
ncbi:MAG: TonB family protein [Bacteroidales bacterium]|nr:TonB family protein [Bacteroidales bacterium]